MHHYYTYMRIIGETTYLLRDSRGSEVNSELTADANNDRRPQRDEGAVPVWMPPGQNPRLDDFLGNEINSKELEQVVASKERP